MPASASTYTDGFVLPLPKKKLPAYRKMASIACKVWMEHGALDYKECVSDDTKAEFCQSFPQGISTKKGEVVVLAWITYKSKAHRDKVNAAVMKDPRMSEMCDPKNPPFDVARMLYGGFKIIVSA